MAKTKVLIMMSGIPGSGKSTWALKQYPLMPEPIIVSRDDIRKSYTKEGERPFVHEPRVFETYIYMLSAALNSKCYTTVFADATQINWLSRKKVIDALKLDDATKVLYVLVNMDTSIPECLIRNRGRKEQVPDGAIFAMNKQHTITELDYNLFDCIYNIGEDGKWELLKDGGYEKFDDNTSASV